MEKKFKVSEFVNKYNDRKSDDLKKKFIDSVIPADTYIPYLVKCTLASGIVNTSSLKGKFVYYDSAKEYIFYIYTMINTYTKIEMNEENICMDYDILAQNGILDIIMNAIPENERVAFQTILNFKRGDLVDNNLSHKEFLSCMVSKAIPEMDIANILESIVNMDEKQLGDIVNFPGNNN